MEGCCRLITDTIAFFQQQQAVELVAQTTIGAACDVCSCRVERAPHSSDLRLRSQDGQSRKEEALKRLANQWLTEYRYPYGLSLPRGEKVSIVQLCNSDGCWGSVLGSPLQVLNLFQALEFPETRRG